MTDEPFPGSPDDMMNTIAALRARVAKLETMLQEVTDICMTILTDKEASDADKQLADRFVDCIRATLQ